MLLQHFVYEHAQLLYRQLFLVVDGEIDLWGFMPLLTWQANVVEVVIREGFTGRDALVRVEFQHAVQQINSFWVCAGVDLLQIHFFALFEGPHVFN